MYVEDRLNKIYRPKSEICVKIFTFLKKNFSFSHIFKLILNSLIFRSILLVLSLLLIYVGGVDEKTYSYFITSLVMLFIIYSFIKAKNIEHIFMLSLNLLFICTFWYVIGVSFSIETVYLFTGSYILLGFDDFDFSGDVKSILGLHLHKKCIGDPGGPGGGGGPDFSPWLCMDISGNDWENRNNFDDRLNKTHNHPALHNYKEYIEFENFKYKVSSIEIDIKEYNDNIPYTKPNELFFEKQAITKHFIDLKQIKIKYSGSRDADITPLEYLSLIQNHIYEYALEYNTLSKAKLYYEKDGTNLSKDYKDAFEIWQKRQIAYCLNLYHNLKIGPLVHDHIANWYQEGVVYDEVRDNLLYAELGLIQSKAIYDGLKARNFNYFRLDSSDFDDFVLSITKSHYEKYKECINFLSEKAIDRFHVDKLSRSAVEFWCKEIGIPFKVCHHDLNSELSDKKVGLRLSEKFSKKEFTISDSKIMSKYIFSVYDSDSKDNNKYYSEKVGFELAEKFSKKKFNYTDYISKNVNIKI